MNTTNKTVCHITTVHTVKDTRIYHKECRALAEAGYKVYLVAVNAQTTESDYDNLHIINVPWEFKSKLERMIKAPKMARAAAESLSADVYHFHDPEFLFQAKKMADKGFKVIYDAHEDVHKQILTKAYIPSMLRALVSKFVLVVENHVIKRLPVVITVVEGISKRVEKLGSKAVLVKNFPDVEKLPAPSPWENKQPQACYVGDYTSIRGIYEQMKASDKFGFPLTMAGRWSDKALHGRSKQLLNSKSISDLGFITKDEVQEVFAKSMVGLVMFHPAPNHMDALPNKLFEYLAAGIPVVVSNFGWLEKIVSEYKCGVIADPLDPESIGRAVVSILEDQAEAKAMGERGRKAVLEKFNWETEKAKLLEVYENLLMHD